jgi:putative ATPase
LLSRCKVYVLNPLQPPEIQEILSRALADNQRGLGACPVAVPEDVLKQLALFANGDARIALNTLELAVTLSAGRAQGKASELTRSDL